MTRGAPGAADAEADGAGVADAAGSPGQVTGRGGRERARRGRGLAPHVGASERGQGSQQPAGAGSEYSAGGGDGTPTWEASGALAGRDDGEWAGLRRARSVDGQREGVRPKSYARAGGRGQDVTPRARGRGRGAGWKALEAGPESFA